MIRAAPTGTRSRSGARTLERIVLSSVSGARNTTSEPRATSPAARLRFSTGFTGKWYLFVAVLDHYAEDGGGWYVALAVVAALNKKRPAHEVAASLKQERERFAALLTARTKDRSILSATAGLAARLRELSESDLRPALPGEAATSTIDLARTLTTDAGVVCFSLDSASDPSVATLAGSLALRDLQHAISARPSGVTPALVLLDEFSVLESDEIKSLLARARSKRVGVVLSTQSLADLTAVDLNLKTQTLSNTATKIIHRLGGDEEPELIASLAGTRTVEEFTHQTIRRAGITGPRHTPTGTGSARRVEEYNLHPNRLRDLKRGHAAVILRAEPQWKGYVRIDNADKRLREISRYRRR